MVEGGLITLAKAHLAFMLKRIWKMIFFHDRLKYNFSAEILRNIEEFLLASLANGCFCSRPRNEHPENHPINEFWYQVYISAERKTKLVC